MEKTENIRKKIIMENEEYAAFLLEDSSLSEKKSFIIFKRPIPSVFLISKYAAAERPRIKIFIIYVAMQSLQNSPI
jgi:hypothetical protein